MKLLLAPLSLIFDFITSIRNLLFDYQILKSTKFNIPIICVGNLSLGGSGKTPHVNYIAKKLNQMYDVAIISRGYKRKNNNLLVVEKNSDVIDVGDEPLMLKKKNPEALVIVSSNRKKAINRVIKNKKNIDVIILDDGYQHRWIKAGLNILLTPSKKPFYDDYLFPLGRLRENKKQCKRADCIIFSNNIEKEEAYFDKIRTKLSLVYKKSSFFSSVIYNKPIHLFSNEILNKLDDKNIILITGIADSSSLENYLNENSNLDRHFKFKDHHNYTKNDVMNILSYFKSIKKLKTLILTTEKDSVKLLQFKSILEDVEIFYIPIDIVINEKFDEKLLNYVSTN